MKRIGVLAVAILALVGTGRANDDPEPPGGGTGLQKLRGSWTVTKAMFQGKEATPPSSMKYKFEGNKLTIDMGKGQMTYTLKLEKNKKPPVMVLTPEKGALTRKFSFDVVKDELYLGTTPGRGSDEPPTTLDGKTGTVLVLKREKK